MGNCTTFAGYTSNDDCHTYEDLFKIFSTYAYGADYDVNNINLKYPYPDGATLYLKNVLEVSGFTTGPTNDLIKPCNKVQQNYDFKLEDDKLYVEYYYSR